MMVSTDGVENILNGIKKDHLNVLILTKKIKEFQQLEMKDLKCPKLIT